MMNMLVKSAIAPVAAIEVALLWDELLAEAAEAAEEAKRLEREAWCYEMAMLDELAEEAHRTGDWSVYSDVYKDIYGVRPRWY